VLKVLGRSPLKAAEEGVFLSLSDDVKTVSGGYFHNKQQIKPCKSLDNSLEQERLWKLTMEMLNIPEGQFGSINPERHQEAIGHVRS
jgi:hypothetical protein